MPQNPGPRRHSADDVATGRPPWSGGPPDESELARWFRDRLLVFAARRLNDVTAAEDVAQETLRRVCEALRDGRVRNPQALPAFVFQTARNICLHRHRSAGREARALSRLSAARDPHSTADPLVALVTEERRRVVRSALARLEPEDRALLRMFFYEASDTEEIARRLGATPGAVRVRKHRALRRLARALADTEP